MPRILYCHCAYAQVLPQGAKEAVLKRMGEAGVTFEAVADLCGMSARQDTALKRWAAGGAVKIAACYPRAVQWLFAAANAPLPPESTEILNLRVQGADEVAAALLSAGCKANPVSGKTGLAAAAGASPAASGVARPAPAPTSAQGRIRLHLALDERRGEPFEANDRLALLAALLEKGFAVSIVGREDSLGSAANEPLLVLGRFRDAPPPQPETTGQQSAIRFQDITGLATTRIVALAEAVGAELEAARPDGWLPWFPVIDYERCTHCMQCLSFCLFDVYGVDVEHRIQVQHAMNCKINCPACSRVCPEAAIIFPKYKTSPINGDRISDTDLQREKMKIDISTLLGGDIYSLLRERNEQARSRFSKERDPETALRERQKCLAKLAQAVALPPEVLLALPAPQEIQRRAEAAKAKARAAVQNRHRTGSGIETTGVGEKGTPPHRSP